MEKIKEIYQKIERNKLAKTQIIAIIGSIILGSLLHFVFEWSGKNVIVASFSAVNESVWEHLKLVFYPMAIFAIIEFFFVNKIDNNYIEAKVIGIFVAMSFIVVSFFTYTGIIGSNIFIIDILIFIISIIIGEGVALKLMQREDESTVKTRTLAIIIFMFLLICFIVCTYIPPEVNLFRDYVTGLYGIIH